MSDLHVLHRGSTPLLVSLPHVGTWIPDDQRSRYVERAFDFEDTDWHLGRLYGFVREQGASLIVPRASRYLVDLNRPPDDAPMYPGANNVELCPMRFFNGDALYREGWAPGAAEIARRVRQYWQPYHDALRAELHRLPDLNLGTAGGASCAPVMRSALVDVLAGQTGFSHVADGFFKGGYITRHFGRPENGIHAVQLEMARCCYMQETAPHAWDEARAAVVTPLLQRLVRTILDWVP